MYVVKNKSATQCPLCFEAGNSFYQDVFYLCNQCKGIFRTENLLPDPKAEKERYDKHHNDIHDSKYRQFVSPITAAVLTCISSESTGLDFGSGKKSLVSAILAEHGYKMKQYDPFYKNEPELLLEKYDFIVCCEVIEHFHHPEKEFHLLKSILKPRGVLFCMTSLYNEEINFNEWYYKNDLTHAFIYQQETMQWIKKKFDFSYLTVDNRLILLSN